MPTNPQTPYLPDPTITLNDLLNPPAAGPNSTPEMDAYYDQGRREALMHVLATGQAPLSERVIPHGPIGAIAQRFGFSPTSQPLPQSVADQVQLAQGIRTNDLAKQQLAQKLATLQAVQPGVIQLGPEYGQAAAKSLGEPELTSAFPNTLKGRGQVGLEEAQMTSEWRNKLAEIQQQIADGKSQLVQQEIANITSEMSAREAGITAREASVGAEYAKLDLARDKAKNDPISRALSNEINSLNTERRTLETTAAHLGDVYGAPLPDTDPRKMDIAARLKAIQNEKAELYAELTGKHAPKAATPPPATAPPSFSNSGKTSKIPGLFGD